MEEEGEREGLMEVFLKCFFFDITRYKVGKPGKTLYRNTIERVRRKGRWRWGEEDEGEER